MRKVFLIGSLMQVSAPEATRCKIQVFDRDLPSIEQRTPARLAPIGEALVEMTASGHGQSTGRFQITYTLEAFQEGEAVYRDHHEGKKHADLSFRVLDANDRPLLITSIKALGREYGGDAILFNVPETLEVGIVVEGFQEPEVAPTGASEYEQLVARVNPVIVDVLLAELTTEDLTFLVHELGLEQDQTQQHRLHWLQRSAELGRETHLPPEMFYGWGRKDVPSPFGELAGLDQSRFVSVLQKLLSFADDELQRTLHLAASEKIIPHTAFEDIRFVRALLQVVLRRLQGLDDATITIPQINGRLLDKRKLTPLARHTVEAKLLLKSNDEEALGTTVSDPDGQFSFADKRLSQPTAQDHSRVRLGLRILNVEGKELLKTEISAVLDGETVPIYVPSQEDEPISVPKLDALASLGGPQLPQELLAFLQGQGITSLEDVWKTGQVATHKDLPPQHLKAAEKLDAHANLFRLSPDVRANAALIEKGFASTGTIADTPEDLFIQQTRFPLGDAGALALHAGAQTERKLLGQIYTDIRIKESMGFDLSDIIPGFRPPRPTPQQCSCRQCETAASPLAYLVDLLSYALTHLRFGFDAGWASPITMEWLTNTFHQPFADLPVSCEAMDTKIRQVRLCVEVLRRYLKTQTVTPERLTRFKQAEQSYRLAVYTTLLAQLGTTYEELRLSRDADQSKVRILLAARLGFTLENTRPDRLDALFLDPASITEVDLERLFGLIDTQISRDRLSDGQVLDDSEQQIRRRNFTGAVWRRTTDDEGLIHVSLEKVGASDLRVELFRDSGRTADSLVAKGEVSALTGTVALEMVNHSGLTGTIDIEYKTNSKKIAFVAVPRILAWRLAHLRTVWSEQDRPTKAGAVPSPPVLDPDVVGLDDLRDPSGPTAELWKARRDQVDGVIKELRDARLAASSPADALTAVLQHANGINRSLDELKAFHTQREAGTDIRPSLAAIPLTIAQFEALIRLGRLVSTASSVPVLESEWAELDAISAKVWKMRQATEWRTKEAEAGLTLGPDYFVIPEPPPLQFPPTPPLTLPAWLATNEERRDWERTLKARIDQDTDTIMAHQKAVDEAEASTIGELRDALIDVLGEDRPKQAAELTKQLLIDFADGTCHVTTRIAQATDTLQVLLFSARTGRLRTSYPTLNLAAPDFDEEWLWMGTYASWRAAQLTFMYCENLCHPTLRDRQSPGFRRLVEQSRALPRMTPEKACTLVKDFNRYFSDVGQMEIKASVWAMTRLYQGTGCLDRHSVDDHRVLHLFGVPDRGHTLYWATFDPEPLGSDKLSFWDWVPALETETVKEVIGATTYTMQNGSRFLFVFVKAIRSGTQVLLFSRFDLLRSTWEINSFPLDLPERGRNFEAVLLKNDENHPPVLMVRHRDATAGPGVPYTRSLNLDGNGWMDGEWFPQWFSPWMTVGTLSAEPGTKVAAVARKSGLDIFTVGKDGGVYHAVKRGPITKNSWSIWSRIRNEFTVPTGSSVTALAHGGNSVQLFVVGHDRKVWQLRIIRTDPFSNTYVSTSWARIGGDGRTFSVKTPITAADVMGYTLLFAFDQNVEVVSTRRVATNAAAPFDEWFRINIDQPPTRNSPPAIIAKRSDSPQAPFRVFFAHIDKTIYGAIGKDNFDHDSWLYDIDTSGTGSNLVEWFEARWLKYSGLEVAFDAPIAGLSLANFHNLFAVATDGSINQLRWVAEDPNWENMPNGVSEKWNRVGQIAVPEKTPIAALSWTDNHMDLFVVGEDQRIYHTWWDINANEGKWHDWGPISQPGITFPKRTPITAVSPRPGHIDLFAVGGDGTVLASWWDSDPNAQWPTKPPDEKPTVDGKPVRCNPIFGFPIDFSRQTSAEFLQIIRGMIRNAYLDTVLPPDGSVGQQRSIDYLDEAYYFVAMYLAQLLQRDGYYIEALDAYRTVYDYTAPSSEWREIAHLLVLNKDDWSKAYERSKDWLEDPLNPHRMAAARPGAYLFYTKMAIARCWVEAGNAQYTLYTPESLPLARTYYMTALEVLSEMRKDSIHPKCETLIGEVNLQLGNGHYEMVLKRDLAKLMHMNDRAAVEETVKKLKTLPVGRNSAYERLQAARTIISEAMKRPTAARRLGETVQETHSLESETHSRLLSVPAVEQIARQVSQQVSIALLSTTAKTLGMTRDRLKSEKPALPWLKNGRRDVLKWTEAGSSSAPWLHNIGDPRVKKEMSLPPVFSQLIPTQVYIPPVSYRFCVPPNPILKGIILEAELNLYKLRRCRDIAGMERAVDLYSAPTDVETDLPTLDEDGQIALSLQSNVRPTNHHYAVLIARAKEMAQIAAQFESSLLSMLEKRDAEAYNEQRARQDAELARAQVRIHDLQVAKDQSSLRLAQLQRERTQVELEHWQGLLQGGKSALELASIDAMYVTAALQGTAAVSAFAAAGNPLNWLSVSEKSNHASLTAQAFNYAASVSNTVSQILAQQANWERRRQEWQHQSSLALVDTRIADQSVDLAEIALRITQEQRRVAILGADYTAASLEFIRNKFTNVALYETASFWLEKTYRWFLSHATAIAQLARLELSFQLQDPSIPKIRADYWEVPALTFGGASQDLKGITGSARLLQDIYALDQHAFEKNKRKLNLTKMLSIGQIAPLELQQFRQTGVLRFATTLDMFDRDFPGDYVRLIKKVGIIIDGTIPREGINASLSCTGVSRVVVDRGPGQFDTVVLRRDPQRVALTKADETTKIFYGVFNSDAQPELLQPFEGLGVETTWEVRMLRASNLIDLRKLSDVRMVIEYTSLHSETYAARVMDELGRTVSHDRTFSLQREFLPEWNNIFKDPSAGGLALTARINTNADDFYWNLTNLRIEQITIQFGISDGPPINIVLEQLRFTPTGKDPVSGSGRTNNGVISSRLGNADFSALINQSPIGKWELSLPNTAQTRDWFKEKRITDIILIITYGGDLPPWPI